MIYLRKKLLTVFIFLLFFFAFNNCSSAQYHPSPTWEFYVNDFANVLDSSTKEYIIDFSKKLELQTKAQIVVVTIDNLNNIPLETYSYRLFNDWGIGDSLLNNGILILLSVGDRSSRIEVGRGLEGALPDGKTGRIQDDYMIPYFVRHDYSKGIKNGYSAILNEVLIEYGIDSSSFETILELPPEEHSSSIIKTLIYILLALVFLIDWIFFRAYITRFLLKYLWFFLSDRGGGNSDGGSSGGSGGGSFGGGGQTGGGGSSRSW